MFKNKPLNMLSNVMNPVVGDQRLYEPKTHHITDDYEISNTVLGLGINGKVVECTNKRNLQKYALKVLHDNPKSRRYVFNCISTYIFHIYLYVYKQWVSCIFG